MKLLTTLLFLITPIWAEDSTSGGCFDNDNVAVDVSTEVSHIFNDASVTFASGKGSITVNGVASGGGDRVSDSSTGKIDGVGQFKVKDGVIEFKKEGTTRWQTLSPCADEGVGTLPSVINHVPSTSGLDHPKPQAPPVIDDGPLPVI